MIVVIEVSRDSDPETNTVKQTKVVFILPQALAAHLCARRHHRVSTTNVHLVIPPNSHFRRPLRNSLRQYCGYNWTTRHLRTPLPPPQEKGSPPTWYPVPAWRGKRRRGQGKSASCVWLSRGRSASAAGTWWRARHARWHSTPATTPAPSVGTNSTSPSSWRFHRGSPQLRTRLYPHPRRCAGACSSRTQDLG